LLLSPSKGRGLFIDFVYHLAKAEDFLLTLYFDNSFIPGYCVLPKVFGLCSQAAALEEKLAANSAAPKEKRAAKCLQE
jgi:hypothetical protein